MRIISLALLAGGFILASFSAFGQNVRQAAAPTETAASRPSAGAAVTPVGTVLSPTKLGDEALSAVCLRAFSGNHPGSAARFEGILQSTSKSVYSWAGRKITFEFKTKGQILVDAASGRKYCEATVSFWDEKHSGFWNIPVAFNGEAAVSWDLQFFPTHPQYYSIFQVLQDGNVSFRKYFNQNGHDKPPGVSHGMFRKI